MREGSNDNVEPVQKTADPGRAGAEEGGRVKRAGPCCPKSKSGTTHSRHRANSIPRCRGSPEIARRAVYGWVHRGRSWESQAINGFSICVRHRKQSAGRQRCRIGHCPTSAPAARAEEPDRGSRFIPPKGRGRATLDSAPVTATRRTRYSAQADTGTQLQKRLRSPWTLSTRPTDGQYFTRLSEATGNTAISRE